MLEIKLVSNPCQQTWHLFLNLPISFFLLYSEFSFSRSTFVFPLRWAWIYDIRNLRYEAQCFLTILKDDNLHYNVSLSNWCSWTTFVTYFVPFMPWSHLFCLTRMTNLKSKFKLFHDSERKVSRPTICRPLVYCIEHWETIIVRRQAIIVLNAGCHVEGRASRAS